MEQYIPKSFLVAEIEKCYNECLKRAKITDSDYWNAKADAYRNVLAILNDTLEVKDVDLDKEIDDWYQNKASKEFERVFYDDIEKFANHFYELGLKESNPLTWQDVILLSEIGEDFMNSWESNSFSEEEYYQEILKRFKAQKGEEV
jgi:hypothetical protein